MEAIWHLTPDGHPARLGDEGFVHASFTSQLPDTLAIHFKDVPRVVLLRLDPRALGERLVIEPSRNDERFPHVYGAIKAGDVLEQVPLLRGPDGRFDLSPLPSGSGS